MCVIFLCFTNCALNRLPLGIQTWSQTKIECMDKRFSIPVIMVSGSQVWDMEFSWQYFCTVVLRALMFGCKNFLCPSDRICMRVSVCEENRDWTLLRSKCNPMFYDWRATSSNRAIVSAIFHAKGVMSSTKRTSNKDSSALNRQADIPHCNTQLNKQGQHILGALRRGWKKDRCCSCCYFHLALPPIDWTISTAKFKREGPNCHDHKRQATTTKINFWFIQNHNLGVRPCPKVFSCHGMASGGAGRNNTGAPWKLVGFPLLLFFFLRLSCTSVR